MAEAAEKLARSKVKVSDRPGGGVIATGSLELLEKAKVTARIKAELEAATKAQAGFNESLVFANQQLKEETANLLKAESLMLELAELEAGEGKPSKKPKKKPKKAARNKEMRDAWKDWDQHQRDLLKLEKKRIRDAAKARKLAEREAMKDATFAVNFGVGLMQGMANELLEGEKNLAQRMTAMVLKQVGQALVAKGTMYAIEGVAMSILGEPRGPALAAQGAVAIAAGIGMGAAGKSITKGLSASSSEASSSRDSDMASSGGGIPTAGGSFGGSRQKSSQTVINISYGVGGPNPEDAAQAVLNAIALGNRRGITANGSSFF